MEISVCGVISTCPGWLGFGRTHLPRPAGSWQDTPAQYRLAGIWIGTRNFTKLSTFSAVVFIGFSMKKIVFKGMINSISLKNNNVLCFQDQPSRSTRCKSPPRPVLSVTTAIYWSRYRQAKPNPGIYSRPNQTQIQNIPNQTHRQNSPNQTQIQCSPSHVKVQNLGKSSSGVQ